MSIGDRLEKGYPKERDFLGSGSGEGLGSDKTPAL